MLSQAHAAATNDILIRFERGMRTPEMELSS